MASLSLSSVVDGTIQVIEGLMVQVTATVNVGGCTENTATVTFAVIIDLNDTFSLVEYSNYAVGATGGNSNGGNGSPAIIAYYTILLVCGILAMLA